MPSAHFSTSSASHPLGTIRWRGGRQPSGFLNSPGPAPEAGDPSLGLPVCAIGLACIFIYFCCCSFFFFFFFSRIRDFLIYFNFFFFLMTTICLGFPGSSVVKNPPAMQEMWVQSLG